MSKNRKREAKLTSASQNPSFFVVERSAGNFYAYSESEQHHRHAEESRIESGLKRVDAEVLDHECEVMSSLAENSYIVISRR